MHNIRDFGAAGDGATDDTPAIEHALSEGGGVLYFPPGQYRITRTVEIDLAQRGPAAIWSPRSPYSAKELAAVWRNT